MFIIDTSKLEPPYDKKGRVTPVTGIKPTTTIKFKIVWNASEKINPKDKYLAKLSFWLIDIFKPLYIMVRKRVVIIISLLKRKSARPSRQNVWNK